MAEQTIMQKLFEIQQEIKVEKGRYNSFGDFDYRSKEDILEALKPLCEPRGLVIKCDDEVRCQANGWVYIVVTAQLIDIETSEAVKATACAREPETKPKMDSSQCTGSASSYAGKRALGNLLALDDTKDGDAYITPTPDTKPVPEGQAFNAKCQNCGHQGYFAPGWTLDTLNQHQKCCPAPDYKVV